MTNELVVFNVIGTPIMYLGKVVVDDVDNGRLVLTDVLMGVTEKGNVQLVGVPSAGKDSKIEIPTGQIPGIKIYNPEEELVKAYDNGILRAYSKLVF